jgi:hypothetical protein
MLTHTRAAGQGGTEIARGKSPPRRRIDQRQKAPAAAAHRRAAQAREESQRAPASARSPTSSSPPPARTVRSGPAPRRPASKDAPIPRWVTATAGSRRRSRHLDRDLPPGPGVTPGGMDTAIALHINDIGAYPARLSERVWTPTPRSAALGDDVLPVFCTHRGRPLAAARPIPSAPRGPFRARRDCPNQAHRGEAGMKPKGGRYRGGRRHQAGPGPRTTASTRPAPGNP